MIYLVGSLERARRWCMDNELTAEFDRASRGQSRELRLVTDLQKVHGYRPILGDSIIALVGQGYDHQAHLYLTYQLKLAEQRREISLRQAP